MSQQNLKNPTNTPRIDLRSIDTEILKRELRARERCATCGTQHARSWKTAGRNRVLCDECAPDHAVDVTS
ncbi:MAG TPA: hypothetical protein VM364_00735 [Vicinamibacterales bacterium]|nr:hypothetical protein [Vicinamibacterales bacterium]